MGEFGYRLFSYPTLRPDSDSYRLLLPLMIVVLALVVCAVPLLLTLYLLVEHRKGHVEAVKGHYHSGAFAVAVQAEPGRQQLLLQLTAMYRASCWWMPPFVLARRLVLVTLLTFVRSSSVWSWLTLLNSAFLALHIMVQPYERRRDNSLETLTLLSLMIQTTVLNVYPPPYTSAALLAVFNSLIAAPLLPAIILVLVSLGKPLWLRAQLTMSPSTRPQYRNQVDEWVEQ